MAGDLDNSVPEKTAISSKRHSENPNLSFNSILSPAKISAWLGISTAGLGILLSVIGFLATGAHDAMLGVPTTFQKLDYIRVGGLFFSRSIIFIFGAIITNKWCWILLVILLIISMLNRYIYRRYPKSVFLFDVFILIFSQGYIFWRLGRPLMYVDMLFKPEAFKISESHVLLAIIKDNKNWLHNEYGFLALLVLCLALAFRLLDRAYENMSASGSKMGKSQLAWKWLRIPAIVILIIILLLLPRAYGVLTLSNEYPQVLSISSATSDQLTSEDSGSISFLLKQDEKFLILYDSHSYTIVNLSLQSVNQYSISKPRLIFNPGGG